MDCKEIEKKSKLEDMLMSVVVFLNLAGILPN